MSNIWLILSISLVAVLFVYLGWLTWSVNKIEREHAEEMGRHIQEVFSQLRKKKEGGEP